MDIKAIKKALPHVEKIYVKGGEWFIHYVPDAELVNLNETKIEEAPLKKTKLK